MKERYVSTDKILEGLKIAFDDGIKGGASMSAAAVVHGSILASIAIAIDLNEKEATEWCKQYSSMLFPGC